MCVLSPSLPGYVCSVSQLTRLCVFCLPAYQAMCVLSPSLPGCVFCLPIPGYVCSNWSAILQLKASKHFVFSVSQLTRLCVFCLPAYQAMCFLSPSLPGYVFSVSQLTRLCVSVSQLTRLCVFCLPAYQAMCFLSPSLPGYVCSVSQLTRLCVFCLPAYQAMCVLSPSLPGYVCSMSLLTRLCVFCLPAYQAVCVLSPSFPGYVCSVSSLPGYVCSDDGCNIAVESFQTLCLFRVNRSCYIHPSEYVCSVSQLTRLYVLSPSLPGYVCSDDGCNIAVESFQTLCLFRLNRSCYIHPS